VWQRYTRAIGGRLDLVLHPRTDTSTAGAR
jgi:hypothetical protein